MNTIRNKSIKLIFITLYLLSFGQLFAQTQNDSFGVERYAVYIGSNDGGKNNVRLMYAGTDASLFCKTMNDIGGVSKENSFLLLDPKKNDIDKVFQDISSLIEKNKSNSKRSEFIFYYSGHSDEESLLLGKQNYSYASLKEAITNVPSDVHVAILDSCYSGNFIRTKGGQKQKSFLVDDSSIVKGHAYLSSSSSKESSQESDEIESSFFTNAMITGLRGAADTSGDKKVTLNELYSYAFDETLAKTENSSSGPQHPNYNITLVGSGDLVLSDISISDCMLGISKDLTGRIIIRDKNGKLISEINKSNSKPAYIALEKGTYSATLVNENELYSSNFDLKEGKTFLLTKEHFVKAIKNDYRERGAVAENSDYDKDYPDTRMNMEGLKFDLIKLDLCGNLYDVKRIDCNYCFALGIISSTAHAIRGVQVSTISSYVDSIQGMQYSGIFNSAHSVQGVQCGGIFNKAKSVQGVQVAGVFNTVNGEEGVRGPQVAGVFNIVNGKEGVQGPQVAGVFNIVNGEKGIQGPQVAGVFNVTKGQIKGPQAAGLFNISKSISGIQAAGAFNISHEDSSGFQIGGLFNISNAHKGFQAGGLFNIDGHESKGVQLAGLFNIVGKDYSGIEIAGLVNVTRDFKGFQLAGLVNVAGDFRGIQFGLVNIANECKGLQFGLVNISRDGILETGISYDSENNVNFFFQSGLRYCYTILGYSTSAQNIFDAKSFNSPAYNEWFAGLGVRASFFQFDFDFQFLSNFNNSYGNHTFMVYELLQESFVYPSMKYSLSFNALNHWSVFAAVNFAMSFNDNNSIKLRDIGRNLRFGADECYLYPDFELGIKYKK